MSKEFELFVREGEVVLVHEEDGVLKQRNGSIAYVSGDFLYNGNYLLWPCMLIDKSNNMHDYFTDPTLIKIVSEVTRKKFLSSCIDEFVNMRSGYNVSAVYLTIKFIPKDSRYIMNRYGLHILDSIYEC